VAPEVKIRFGFELVVGLVAAIGTNLESAVSAISDQLRAFNYEIVPLRLSELAEVEAKRLGVKIKNAPESDRIRTHMNAGDKLRERYGDDWLVQRAIAEISRWRGSRRAPREKIAYIVRSLKHPKEVETLRRVYGPGFFLISLFSTENERFEYLTKTMRCSEVATRKLGGTLKKRQILTDKGHETHLRLGMCLFTLVLIGFRKSCVNF